MRYEWHLATTRRSTWKFNREKCNGRCNDRPMHLAKYHVGKWSSISLKKRITRGTVISAHSVISSHVNDDKPVRAQCRKKSDVAWISGWEKTVLIRRQENVLCITTKNRCVCVCVCGVPLGVAPWHTNEKNDLLQVALLLIPVTGNAHRTRICSNPFLGWIVYTKISRSDGCWELGNRGSRLKILLHYFRHRLQI